MWLDEQYPNGKDERKLFIISAVQKKDIPMNNYVGGIIGNLGISGETI